MFSYGHFGVIQKLFQRWIAASRTLTLGVTLSKRVRSGHREKEYSREKDYSQGKKNVLPRKAEQLNCWKFKFETIMNRATDGFTLL